MNSWNSFQQKERTSAIYSEVTLSTIGIWEREKQRELERMSQQLQFKQSRAFCLPFRPLSICPSVNMRWEIIK